MSVFVIVHGPLESERLLGVWGKNSNFALVGREDKMGDPLYQHMIDWVVENDIRCRVLPMIDYQEIAHLIILFSSEELEESFVRRVNDDYMRFKLTFSGREVVTWRDDDYEKCKLVSRRSE